jgi:hypothetical protein
MQHVHDAADHPTVVDPVRPGRPRGNNGSIRAHSPSLNQYSFTIQASPRQEA